MTGPICKWGAWSELVKGFSKAWKAHWRTPPDWHSTSWNGGSSSLEFWVRWLDGTFPPISPELLARCLDDLDDNSGRAPSFSQVRRLYDIRAGKAYQDQEARMQKQIAAATDDRPATAEERHAILLAAFPDWDMVAGRDRRGDGGG